MWQIIHTILAACLFILYLVTNDQLLFEIDICSTLWFMYIKQTKNV